ncbi:MAG: DUF364 domain-containing protein [Ancrocorticia sp.]|jgi:uncharacterized protein (DUF4213/DUF364 family)|nr:DUF364 domain-containing protein [Ancrocorticia sp.]MCI2001467.1 DUF364 domain-containing protein [Ancrocorticia sp.]MCI2013347.1 DUF364 domain-containing protein [Ancrocorticia sp.]MCI2029955.1 DUF364 domain-containing protein [Ancrocorticia sp.]
MEDPWEIYNALVDGIPASVTVERALSGAVSVVWNSQGGCGIATTDTSTDGEDRAARRPGDANDALRGVGGAGLHVVGVGLRDVAALVKSWDFREASLGAAALNSWYTTASRIKEARTSGAITMDNGSASVFAAADATLQGRSAAMIGHFPHAAQELAHAAHVTVIERQQQPGDLPDSACEYVLPGVDAVFITGMTLANKTLPRLLELARGADVYLVGPSVPFAPEVFRGSARFLAGSYVTDSELAWKLGCEGRGTHAMQPALTRYTARLV